MTNQRAKTAFLAAAREWVCDSYAVGTRFIAVKQDNKTYLSEAVISIYPLPGAEDGNFFIDLPELAVGHFQSNNWPYTEIIDLIEKAVMGSVHVYGNVYSLPPGATEFYSEMSNRERWFSDLHLQVSGPRSDLSTDVDFISIDNELRLSNPPFDGLSDVIHWLSLTDPRLNHIAPSIKIRVAPPIDLMTDERSHLRDDELELVFHAHPKFDVSKVRAAVGCDLN